MAHFAHIDKNGIVTQVIVAEQDFIDSGAVGKASEWVQTSYNTCAGVNKNGGVPLRKNYAGIGYTYDKTRDAFIPPHIYPSWALNEETCLYESPKPRPKDGFYRWNEKKLDWEEIEAKV